MANSNTVHSKKLRAATAAKYTREKMANGELRQINIRMKTEDMAIIDEAVARAGGSRVQALLKICREWLAQQ